MWQMTSCSIRRLRGKQAMIRSLARGTKIRSSAKPGVTERRLARSELGHAAKLGLVECRISLISRAHRAPRIAFESGHLAGLICL
jgi:hypothetical protein